MKKKHLISIDEYLKNLYKLPFKNNTDETFYDFLKSRLSEFVNSLDPIDLSELTNTIHEERCSSVKPTYTVRRLKNLVIHIIKDLLNVYIKAYKGNIKGANDLLRKILYNKQYGEYLVEPYCNYLDFDLEDCPTYYRMRDQKIDTPDDSFIDNCFHVPYEKRACAYTGRFNMSSFPCLYLGDSKETCNSEIGKLKNHHRRWVSSFHFKKTVLLYNFTIPTEKDIKEANALYKFCYIINYPLLLSCLTERKREDSDEEYIMPQLLMHLMLLSDKKETSHKGFIFSSTKNKGGYNIIIPAYLGDEELPRSGYSKELQDMFDVSTPEIYKQR